MFKIEITDGGEHTSFTSRETGQVFDSIKYRAFLHIEGEPYPTGPFNISVPRERPVGKGFYEIGPKSFEVVQSRLQFTRRLDLIPVASPGAAKAPGTAAKAA